MEKYYLKNRLSYVDKFYSEIFNSEYEIIEEYQEKEAVFYDGDWDEPTRYEFIDMVRIKDLKNNKIHKLTKDNFERLFTKEKFIRTIKVSNREYVENMIKKFNVINIYKVTDGFEIDIGE